MFPEIPIKRVLDNQGGLDIIGEVVPELEANITKVGVYVDADTGDPVLAYAPFPGDFADFRNALLGTPMSTTLRGGTGMRNVSRTFGFAPKSVPLKRESCRPTSLAYHEPEVHARIVAAARRLEEWLIGNVPGVVDRSYQASVGIDDEWRLSDDVYWTSGVVNLSSSLPYHRDRNNFPVWSAMPVARRAARGGYLDIPEYDAVVEARDGWVVYFNGHQLTHGVTPMRITADDGYRLSCVYYCLRGMVNCADDAREQARARQVRTDREREMAKTTIEDLRGKIRGRATGGTNNLPLSKKRGTFMRTRAQPALGPDDQR